MEMDTMNTDKSRPFDFLSESIGKQVLVEIKGNVQFRGVLKAFDIHMNIVLEKAEQLENNETKKQYGNLILRGDNVILISP
ncbi:MAG: LSm family protein [Candidatus Diapherotrites archaeon]|nr:LSm family protein [Candidatus Diapherotrites archaeon]